MRRGGFRFHGLQVANLRYGAGAREEVADGLSYKYRQLGLMDAISLGWAGIFDLRLRVDW